jgi:uncharacterized protein YfaT (DUF1175 family)
MRYARYHFHNLRNDPRIAGWYQRVAGQPSWVWKFAAIAALAVLVVPVLMLVFSALAAFLLVFVALGVAHRLGVWLNGLFEKHSGSLRRSDDGRRNVRVVDPRDR